MKYHDSNIGDEKDLDAHIREVAEKGVDILLRAAEMVGKCEGIEQRRAFNHYLERLHERLVVAYLNAGGEAGRRD